MTFRAFCTRRTLLSVEQQAEKASISWPRPATAIVSLDSIEGIWTSGQIRRTRHRRGSRVDQDRAQMRPSPVWFAAAWGPGLHFLPCDPLCDRHPSTRTEQHHALRPYLSDACLKQLATRRSPSWRLAATAGSEAATASASIRSAAGKEDRRGQIDIGGWKEYNRTFATVCGQ